MTRSKRSRGKKGATTGRVEEKSKEKEKEEGPTVCLFLQHYVPEMNFTLNVIRLPLNLSEQTIDSEGFIVPESESESEGIKHKNIHMIPFEKVSSFRRSTACVNIGSKIYFLGGMTGEPEEDPLLTLVVQVIDIDEQEPKLRSLAPMNTPKDSPCVFVADGMIYALNSPPTHWNSMFPSSKRSGFFERYLPLSDCWEVLPDPPSFDRWSGAQLLDCATVIGRRVFIGCPYFHAIFDLDLLTWDKSVRPEPANLLFPYGSLFVQQQQSASLYYLAGPGVYKRLTFYLHDGCFAGSSPVVKRIPLPVPNQQGFYGSNLLNYPGGKEHISAQALDLDENYFFTKEAFFPFRELLHVGGPFFCYIVTAHLFDPFYHTRLEHYSRALLIKFFEEVPAHTDGYSTTIFRPVASFCYKIKTNFFNCSSFIRCSVIGTVPDSWVNSPSKKKQESKLKSTDWGPQEAYSNKERDVITHDQSLENDDRETGDLKKLIAARKEKISILKEELAKEEELLTTYERGRF